MLVKDYIEELSSRFESADIFFGHGTSNARDEACYLVFASLNLDWQHYDAEMEKLLDGEQLALLEKRVRIRIEKRLPTAYLVGIAWFAGYPFRADKRALVPRSPIAELIVEQFHPWVEPKHVLRVLDMCTGGGCIAIAIASYMPWTQVDAVDISREALDIAAANISRHDMQQRVTLIESDLFHSLPACRYDLIVANPPYVPGDTIETLPGEYQAEPVLGLASGSDGLDATLSILAAAPDFLTQAGVLVCEVGESEHRLQEILPGLPFVWLDFAGGGAGVFVLTQDEMKGAASLIGVLTEERTHVA